LLDGFRGSTPVDLDRIADAVARVSELIADHADKIAEIDVNPLICTAEGTLAVDALILRSQAP
ncbi:MAG: acetate--CoA ligase family protein, partial [Alphaproteobacteria bacterium]|nr:acetate--CoA ligase family protein [Alphaproteobacteria bacterium]